MFETFQLPFMQRAFLIGAIAAIPFGLIGTFVVVRRIGYLAGAIAHCAFGGIGIGLYGQYLLAATVLATFFPPMGVSVLVAVFSAMLIGLIQTQAKEREDTIIGVIWAAGMALGLLLLELTPGNVNIANYLFGNILLITQADVFWVSSLSVVVLFVVLVFFKRLEAVCFDEEFARLRGVATMFYFQLLLILTALTVVLLVRVVGIVLVIAMLTLPAATACRFAKRLFPICLLAILFGWVVTWLGLVLSVCANLSTGPTIVLVAAAVYLVSLLYPFRLKIRKNPSRKNI
ncbi:MAG: metal ABC transporter permease [Planctomycetaceae bacterium]|jgi:zinc transport system permease protein|nr:metal ABC transporter permease [Planctomycetaceae bacterium]